MIKFYLLLNCFFYLGFSFWCLFKTDTTAKYLGYSFLNNSGKIEYSAIYVGLELAIAAFFAISAFSPSMRLAALIFCVCMYSGLILTRTISAFYYGNISNATFIIGGLEYALGIYGTILLINELKQ